VEGMMGKVITYKNDFKHSFCQIKLDSGEKVLISMGSGTLRISKLLLGVIPTETIWESGDAKTIMRIFLEGDIKHPLDAARDKVLTAKSINYLKMMLV
jgi:hypothetical protein